MRYRMGIAAMTGLGNPSSALLNNQWSGIRPLDDYAARVFAEATEVYFTFGRGKEWEWAGCDFGITADEVKFGIEPSYMYEHLLIISIQRSKANSYIERGVAWGGWGSDIAKRRKYYSDYKYKGKFVRLVDKWHAQLFGGADA